MQLKRSLIFLAVSSAFCAGLLMGIGLHGGNADALCDNLSSDARKTVLLRNATLSSSDGALSITGESVQFLDEATGSGKAAITDGTCTREQVDDHSCFSNPFYIRSNGYDVTVPLTPNAELSRIDYLNYGSDNIIERVADMSDAKLPLLVQVEIDVNTGVALREVYVP